MDINTKIENDSVLFENMVNLYSKGQFLKYFKQIGVSTVDDFLKINGSSLIEILKILGASDDKLDEIRLFYRSSFLDDISDIILYDNVKDTLVEETDPKGINDV